MKKSFYHYMMKYRDGFRKDELTTFAIKMYEDHSFPKQSADYDEISTYLELSGVLNSMVIFDTAWDKYIQEA
ncbi:MAG: YozE family protein [Ectobacillus sp.]